MSPRLLVVVPYYTPRPSEAGAVAHLRAVAAASAVPIVVYNIPYRTGCGLGAGALLELAATPNVAGRQAGRRCPRPRHARRARARPTGSTCWWRRRVHRPDHVARRVGAIAAAAHVRTGDFAGLVAAALAGDAATAARLAHDLLPVVDAGFAEPSPAVWKAALHALG